MSIELESFETPGAFLSRAGEWLLEREDHHNLFLGLAAARAEAGWSESDAFWGVVRDGERILGCAIRTPPHKVLVTDLPTAAAAPVVAALADRYTDLPAILGPAGAAEAVAIAWVRARGGGWRPGMEQGIYRLDEVTPPTHVRGVLREAEPSDLDLAMAWGGGFTRDTGVAFPTKRAAVEGWIERRALHLWIVDEAPVSIAVAQGRTPNGIRVGYVYTPEEHRRRGYASACVAALSQKLLDSGLEFCVLYTDLANPTSNDIYRRVGYRLIERVRDYDLVTEDEL